MKKHEFWAGLWRGTVHNLQRRLWGVMEGASRGAKEAVGERTE